jgi:hypothetical protein
VLGGSGETLDNLASCWRDTNTGPNSMRTIETQAQKLVKQGNVVLYTATALYQGNNPMPYAFQLSYSWWTDTGQYVNTVVADPIFNNNNGKNQNLGTFTGLTSLPETISVNPLLAELEALLPPPAVDIVSPPWSEAAVPFPSDYQAFVAQYGFGSIEFDDKEMVLFVAGPSIAGYAEPNGFEGFVADNEMTYPIETYIDDEPFEYPLRPFPEPGSFVRFGGSDAADEFMWYVAGPDPDTWPAIAWSRHDGNTYRTEGGMLAFLVELLSGRNGMSPEVVGSRPRWIAWSDWENTGLEASAGPATAAPGWL